MDQRTTTSTDQPEVIRLRPRSELSYEPDSSVEAPKAGGRIHKRVHRDGNPQDPYTLQADGKPLGAEQGPMPRHLMGMEEVPSNHGQLVEQGWPDLNYNGGETFDTFREVRPVEIPEGTKIYRLVDEKNNDAGGFWAYDLPKNKTEWRREFAVKDHWNDDGYYVEHVVGKDGLKAWEGPAVGQSYEEFLEKEFYLEGGGKQLFITPNTVEISTPQLTDWPEP